MTKSTNFPLYYHFIKQFQVYNKNMQDIKINSLAPNSLKQLEENKWDFVKTIYNGSYCDVHQVIYKSVNYALKIIDLQRITVDNYQFQYRRIYNEIKVLCMTNHKNIIKLLWHKQYQKKVYLLFELFGLRLSKYLKKNKLNEEDMKIISRQLAQGLNYLHIKGLIHRDISTDNILIDEQLYIKIIDFGYSNQLAGRRQTYLGTIEYAAPQVLNNQSYNHKADIWSFGIVLYYLYHHKTPFCPTKDTSDQQINKNRNNLNFKFDANAPPLYVSLIKSILVLDPQKRPDLDEILKGPWLRVQQQHMQDFEFKDYSSQQDRKTSKMQPISNQQQYSIKQMPIKQLQTMLINLSKMHAKQLIRKRNLLQQLIKSQVKLSKLMINRQQM